MAVAGAASGAGPAPGAVLAGGAAGNPAPVSVSQLATQIAGAVARGFPVAVSVVGEVSGFRDRTHWYFDLKDAVAVLGCVMFASSAKRARFAPRDGLQVVVKGRVEFYEKQGRVTLLVESIEPVGAGALELAYRALLEELRGLGWMALERKRRIPAFPRRVAVVSSRTGAALQDVLDTMRRRCPAVEVALVDVRVQGDGAAGDVVRALELLGRHRQRLGIDAILLTRGGGSIEDLWTFNEREVARAIVECPVPVVAAIGHETDTTIAELVADLRCATPTQAAMRLTPDGAMLLEQLDALEARLRREVLGMLGEGPRLDRLGAHLRAAIRSRVAAEGRRLAQIGARLQRQRPDAMLERRRGQIEALGRRLGLAMGGAMARVDLDAMEEALSRAMATRVSAARVEVDHLAQRLAAVGPESVLSRGFAYVMKSDGTLVRSVADAAAGDALRTRVRDGEIRSTVDAGGVRPGKPRAGRKPPVGGGPGPEQMDLFRADR